jgi:hypothetical protein
MKKFRMLIISILAVGVILLSVQPVRAVPPIPSGFYGKVKLNDANVLAGTVISANINGTTYASSPVEIYQGESWYSLDVPGDDSESPGTLEGGKDGDPIVFFIGGIQATQTATWHSGTFVALDLTGFGVEPLEFTIFLPLIVR